MVITVGGVAVAGVRAQDRCRHVGGLHEKWEFTTTGDVSATPAVDGDTVYFPDWSGQLYAVDSSTGKLRWRTSIASATGVPFDKARATPAVTLLQ